MKIWIKYLIAIMLGIAVGMFIPIPVSTLDTAVLVFVNLARIILVPLLFFSIPIAAFELHEEKKLLRVSLRSIMYGLAAIFLLTIIGAGTAFLIPSSRIPLGSETGTIHALPSLSTLFLSIVPGNVLGILGTSDYLIPILILGTVLGISFTTDKAAAKPITTFSDSMSHLLWHINSFIIEVFPLALIVLAAARTAAITDIKDIEIYGKIFSIIGVEVIIVTLGMIPLAIFLSNKHKNPFSVLYAMLAPAIIALASCNSYAPGGAILKHLKESLGIRRRIGTLSMPLVLTFGRAGTAMVSATLFIVVIASYSSIGLNTSTFLWLLLFVPFSAILSGAAPALGPIASVAFLCANYGKGFESGYLLLIPIALPLAAIGAFLDTLIAGTLVKLVALAENETKPREIRHFI